MIEELDMAYDLWEKEMPELGEITLSDEERRFAQYWSDAPTRTYPVPFLIWYLKKHKQC